MKSSPTNEPEDKIFKTVEPEDKIPKGKARKKVYRILGAGTVAFFVIKGVIVTILLFSSGVFLRGCW